LTPLSGMAFDMSSLPTQSAQGNPGQTLTVIEDKIQQLHRRVVIGKVATKPRWIQKV
jgi:hypothetical protein